MTSKTFSKNHHHHLIKTEVVLGPELPWVQP
jgi:hypothetical protein